MKLSARRNHSFSKGLVLLFGHIGLRLQLLLWRRRIWVYCKPKSINLFNSERGGGIAQRYSFFYKKTYWYQLQFFCFSSSRCFLSSCSSSCGFQSCCCPSGGFSSSSCPYLSFLVVKLVLYLAGLYSDFLNFVVLRLFVLHPVFFILLSSIFCFSSCRSSSRFSSPCCSSSWCSSFLICLYSYFPYLVVYLVLHFVVLNFVLHLDVDSQKRLSNPPLLPVLYLVYSLLVISLLLCCCCCDGSFHCYALVLFDVVNILFPVCLSSWHFLNLLANHLFRAQIVII